MAESTKPKCEDCKLRSKYDENPKSFTGRFWRWHIKWCPGWKEFMNAISNEERDTLMIKYKIKK